jgi:hypothetical protein
MILATVVSTVLSRSNRMRIPLSVPEPDVSAATLHKNNILLSLDVGVMLIVGEPSV